MALTRITTWASGQVLTAAALNGEFNAILDNALALISPLTGNLNANGYSVTNLGAGSLTAPGIAFTGDSNTGLTSSAADVLDFVTAGVRGFQIASASAGVNWLLATPGNTAVWPTLQARGTDTNIGLRLEPAGTGYVGARRGRSTGSTFWPSYGFYDEHGREVVSGIMQISAGTLDLIAGGARVLQASAYLDATNYARLTPSKASQAVVLDVAGADTNIALTVDTKGTGALTLGSADTSSVTAATVFIPASLGSGPAIPNIPVQHGLYRENVIRGWANFKGTAAASIYGSFNVTSIARNNDGEYTITWATDFAATPYAVAGIAQTSATNNAAMVVIPEPGTVLPTAGAIDLHIRNLAGTHVAPEIAMVIATGAQ